MQTLFLLLLTFIFTRTPYLSIKSMDNILVVMAHSSYSFGYGTSPVPSDISDIGPMTLSTILLCDPNVGNSYMSESPRDVFNLLMYM